MNTSFYPKSILTAGIVSLLLACAGQAQAQTNVSGRALDQQKQDALSFATVVLKTTDASARVVQSTLATETGQFALRAIPPGSYQLQVLMMGYTTHVQTVEVAAGSPPELDLGAIALPPATQQLKEVTVTGRRPVLEQRPDRVVMNVEGSVLAAGNDAYHLLAMAPTVQLVDNRLTFRGKSNVLILLNGKRLPGVNLETVLASIPGDQIERIELISNPSAKYDADASGGVIEIYTKRSKTPGWAGNVGGNLSQGFRPGGGLNGGLRASTAKLDVSANGGYNNRRGIERGYEDRVLYQGRDVVGALHQDNNFSTVMRDASLSGSLSYHLNPRNTVGADVQAVQASMAADGQLRAAIEQNGRNAYSSSFNDASVEIRLRNYNVFYKRTLDSLGSNVLLTTNYARYSSEQQQNFNQDLQTEAGRTNSLFRNSASSDYDIYTGALDYTKVWSPATRLETGLKYTDTGNESRQLAETLVDTDWVPQTSPFNRLGYQERIGAGYASLNHTRGKLSLQLGLRAEQTQYRVVGGRDSSYFNLFPNLRADYKLTPEYTTSVAYARNVNRPSYESLIPYELFINNYTSRRGNAALRPEYAHSFSWNHLYKGFGLQLGYTQTTNAISAAYLYDPATLRFIMTFNNFRQRHLATATFTAPLAPAKWWSINNSVGLLYQQLSFPDPLQEAALYTKQRFYYNVSTDHTFHLGKDWTVQLYGVYNSPSFSGMLDYSAFSNVRAGVKKTFLANKASLKLDVVDLFYQSNVRISSDVVPVVTDGINRTDTRRVRLTFTYKLGKTNLKSKQVQTRGNADELNRLGK